VKPVFYRVGNINSGKFADFDTYEDAMNFASKYSMNTSDYQCIKFEAKDLVEIKFDPSCPVVTIESKDKSYQCSVARREIWKMK